MGDPIPLQNGDPPHQTQAPKWGTPKHSPKSTMGPQNYIKGPPKINRRTPESIMGPKIHHGKPQIHHGFPQKCTMDPKTTWRDPKIHHGMPKMHHGTPRIHLGPQNAPWDPKTTRDSKIHHGTPRMCHGIRQNPPWDPKTKQTDPKTPRSLTNPPSPT